MSVPNRVYTLRQAAKILGETERALRRAALGMLCQHGSIKVIDEDFAEDEWPLATAFSEEGIEHLRFLIDQSKRDLP